MRNTPETDPLSLDMMIQRHEQSKKRLEFIARGPNLIVSLYFLAISLAASWSICVLRYRVGFSIIGGIVLPGMITYAVLTARYSEGHTGALIEGWGGILVISYFGHVIAAVRRFFFPPREEVDT